MQMDRFEIAENPFSCSGPLPLEQLTYAVSQEIDSQIAKDVVSCTAPVVVVEALGNGISELAQRLVKSLDPAITRILLNGSSFRNHTQDAYTQEPNEDARDEVMRRFSITREFAIEQAKSGNTVVILIEDAHALEPWLMEQLLSLSNCESGETARVKTILFGLPDVLDKLRQLKGNAAGEAAYICYNLDKYRQLDVPSFVANRLAGTANKHAISFTDEAIQMIAHYSGGKPGLVNTICGWAFLLAWRDSVSQVSASIIDEAAFRSSLLETPGRDTQITEFPEGKAALEFLDQEYRIHQNDPPSQEPVTKGSERTTAGDLSSTHDFAPASSTNNFSRPVEVGQSVDQREADPGKATTIDVKSATTQVDSRKCSVANGSSVAVGTEGADTEERDDVADTTVDARTNEGNWATPRIKEVSDTSAESPRDVRDEVASETELMTKIRTQVAAVVDHSLETEEELSDRVSNIVGDRGESERFWRVRNIALGLMSLGIVVSVLSYLIPSHFEPNIGEKSNSKAEEHIPEPADFSKFAVESNDEVPVSHGGGLPSELSPEQTPPSNSSEVESLLARAQAQYKERKLTTPAGDNALDTYRTILNLRPGYQPALEGIDNIEERYKLWAEANAQEGKWEKASNFYKKALAIDPLDESIRARLRQIDHAKQIRKTLAAPAESEVRADHKTEQRLLSTLEPRVYRIQVGAFSTEPLARREWQRLQREHRALLANLALQLKKTELDDGTTMYRAQSELLDGMRARSICETLKQHDEDCVVLNTTKRRRTPPSGPTRIPWPS